MTFFLPKGLYGKFLIAYRGTNGATPKTRDDLGNLNLVWNGNSIMNVDVELLSYLADNKAGYSTFVSNANGVLNALIIVPCGTYEDNKNAYLVDDRTKVYFKLEEIYQRIKEIYNRYKINYISIQTGQGYHFVFKLPYENPLHNKLVSLSDIEISLKGKYKVTTTRRKKVVSETSARGFHNAGRIIEYFAHILLQNMHSYKGLPVVFSDVSIGNYREAISIDLSMYGDPIYLRDIRVPFSSYQKHKIYSKFKSSVGNIHPFIVLPREINGVEYFSYKDLLSMRTDVKKVVEYSDNVNCLIPSVGENFEVVLSDYQNSVLYKIHKNFDSVDHDNPNIWYKTYDKFDINILPPCVRHCLIEPNDHLLKPTNLQTLTRVLLKLGWHPKHIAGLVRSKYERNYGWGEEWFKYDASSRANFYVRIYSDLLLSGIDKKEDLNCISHQEKGYCYKPNCGYNLANYR
jgi:hypothetical protein